MGVSSGWHGKGRGRHRLPCKAVPEDGLTDGWSRGLDLLADVYIGIILSSLNLPPSLLYFKNRGDSISQVTLLQAAAYVCQFCALSVK